MGQPRQATVYVGLQRPIDRQELPQKSSVFTGHLSQTGLALAASSPVICRLPGIVRTVVRAHFHLSRHGCFEREQLLS